MSTFASTLMPTVSARPAMPGNVIEAPKEARMASSSTMFKVTAMFAKMPDCR